MISIARETRRIAISWKVGNRVIVLRWSVPRVWENPHTRGVPSSYFSFALGSRSRERRFARPIYVYSSHGYSSVKSRSNHPIYGRIQMRVSFTNAHAVELSFPIKIRVSTLYTFTYTSSTKTVYYRKIVKIHDYVGNISKWL